VRPIDPRRDPSSSGAAASTAPASIGVTSAVVTIAEAAELAAGGAASTSLVGCPPEQPIPSRNSAGANRSDRSGTVGREAIPSLP
jgi:hypothetical protein